MRHGTYLGYDSDGCRCDDCSAAWAAYNQRLKLRHARGEVWADAQPARDHIEQLLESGLTKTEIVKAAGLAYWTILHIERGRKRILPATEERILSIPVPCIVCGEPGWAGGRYCYDDLPGGEPEQWGDLPTCGNAMGAAEHRKVGEDPCEACLRMERERRRKFARN